MTEREILEVIKARILTSAEIELLKFLFEQNTDKGHCTVHPVSRETADFIDQIDEQKERARRAEYAVHSLKLALEHSHKEIARLTDAVNALAANRAQEAPVHPPTSMFDILDK